MAIIVTRRELYDRVWREPMIRVAQSFGISDVGLAKICGKHDIPRPPRGYWAKKEFGQTPPQLPLPDPDRTDEIEMSEPRVRFARSESLPQEVRRSLKKVSELEPRIEIAENLRGAHELVSRSNQELQSIRPDDNGILHASKNSPLELSVSKAALRRALLIFDALFKAMEKHGYAIKPGPQVEIDGVDVGFSIEEHLETKRTEAEDHDLEGSYRFGFNRLSEARVPSGSLTIRLRDGGSYWDRGARHRWRDSDKRRVEDCLSKVVQGLISQAARLKEHREEAKRQEQARRAAEERSRQEAAARAEKREQVKAEQSRVDALMEKARNWRNSRDLRDFIDAVQRTHLAAHGNVQPGSEIADWLLWATQQADRLDRLRTSPPSILDTPLHELEEPQKSYFRSW